MKKSFFYLLNLSFAAMMLLTACSETNKSGGDYLAVKVSGDNNWSILDVNTGDFIYRDEFGNCPSVVVDNLFFVEKDKGNGYECYNVNNISKSINDEVYMYACNFQCGVAPVLKKGDPITIINTEGTEIKALDKKIVETYPFMNGYAVVVSKDNKVGAIDTKGNWIIKADYESIIPFSQDGYAITFKKQNDTIYNYTIVDGQGQKFYSFSSEKYIPLGSIVNGSMPVKKGDKVIYIDANGERIAEAGKYFPGREDAYGIYDGVMVYSSEDMKMGLMTQDGEKLIRDKYDMILPQKDGTFVAYRDGKCGLIDKNDKVLLPFDFYKIQRLSNNRYVVREGMNKYSLIDGNGGEISKETFASISLYNDAPIIFEADTKMKTFVDEMADVAELIAGFNDIISSTTAEEYSDEDNADESENSEINVDEAESTIPYAWLSERLANESDLQGKSKAEIRIMRNTIYAMHGYIFKTSDMKSHFGKQPWYKAEKSDVTTELSSIENQNVQFLKAHE